MRLLMIDKCIAKCKSTDEDDFSQKSQKERNSTVSYIQSTESLQVDNNPSEA